MWQHLGVLGIGVGMLLESAGIPVPSEVLLPLAGVLVAQGRMSFVFAIVLVVVAQTAGSLIGYAIGLYGGRALALRIGRYLLFGERELSPAESWFVRYGSAAVFIGRLLPVVRTFISWPAGFAAMSMARFLIYTVLGTLLWSIAFVYVGSRLGTSLGGFGHSLHNINLIFGVIIVLAILAAIWHRRRGVKL